MASRFPEGGDFAFSHRIAAAKMVVFSRSGKRVDAPDIRMATRPLAEEVAALKAGKGTHIVAFGGAAFAAELLGQRLVDEIQFYVNPVALGEGLQVFRHGQQSLTRLETTPYECGITVMRCQPVEEIS